MCSPAAKEQSNDTAGSRGNTALGTAGVLVETPGSSLFQGISREHHMTWLISLTRPPMNPQDRNGILLL